MRRKRIGTLASLAALVVLFAGLPAGPALAQEQPAACVITPFDALGGSFRGSGFGTPQRVVENVTVKAQDHAVFQAVCESPDTVAFTLTVQFWFEAERSPGVWEQSSPTFTCSTFSAGFGTIHAAALSVPGTQVLTQPSCDFRHFYPENHPDAFKNRRLATHLTTTVGNDSQGTSLAWPPL